MSWTDDRVDLLKQLWTEGHSASQIADRLGGVSRNAVIGKVHRLKLESRMKAPGVIEAVTVEDESVAEPMMDAVAAVDMGAPARLVASQSVAARSMPRTMGATALKIELEDVADAVSEVAAERQTGEVVPISRKLSLVQLSERTCKWPVGDPLKADFHFCGNNPNESSPYCAYHARLAFQPSSERRRVR